MRKLTCLTVVGLTMALSGPAAAQYYGSTPGYGAGAYNQYGGSYGYSAPYGASPQGYQQPYGYSQYGQSGSGYGMQSPAYGYGQGYGNTVPGAYGSYDPRDQRRSERRQDRVDLRMDIETALHQRGYDVGRIDGDIDEQSRAAIRQYQTDAGLPADGRPSQDLLAHIETSTIRAYSGYTSPGAFIDRFLNR